MQRNEDRSAAPRAAARCTGLKIAACVAAALGSASVAHADTMLGDFSGDNVSYNGVTTPGTTFSSPQLTQNDQLIFAGDSNFEVQSQNGGASSDAPQTASDSVSSVVRAATGRGLTDLNATVASGAAFRSFGGAVTEDTRVLADVRFDVLVTEVDGAALATPVPLTSSGTAFAYDFVAYEAAGDFGSVSGSFAYDLDDAALAQGISQPITEIDWDVTVSFRAESVSGTFSQLDLTGFEQLVLTVPEPASGVVVAAFGGACLLRRRRVAA